MSVEVLALGDRFSFAYRSVNEAVRNFGKITYKDERTFKNVEDGMNFIGNSSFDVVLMPNPYGNQRRRGIYERLRKVEFPVVAFDRGALPDSWFFDVGFNADSPSYHPLQWDRPITDKERQEVHRYIARVKNDLKPLEKQAERIGADKLRKVLDIGDRKMLFIPLQRPSDTTTRFFSAPLKNLDDFYNLIRSFALRTGSHLSDWVIVAKKHPLEVERPEIPVVFADHVHVNDLIEAADAVLLVNSGTGVLSLCWEKPVLIAGTAFYAHPKLNCQVKSADDIEYALKDPPVVDLETRDRFMHHLTTRVYSFGNFHTELVRQADGAFRNVTIRIDFNTVCVPDCLKKKSCST